MIALRISEIKHFMNQLLCTETFDHFLLQEAIIQKDAAWSVDGKKNPDYYSNEEEETLGLTDLSFLPFSLLRPHCFNLIKGKRTPSYFKFVFLLSPKNLARTLSQSQTGFTISDISGCFLNLKFQNGELTLTTGVSYRTFSPDKSFEQEWDRMVRLFLKNHQIPFEEL